MNKQQEINFKRISEAIEYIRTNFKSQPSVDEIAEKVHVSPAHFTRMFSEWAGTSPKRFLQYISIEHAKGILKQEQATLFDTSHQTGLSSTSRLHDLFTHIEGMTPAEYKNGGYNLQINYHFSNSPFGKILIASTLRGICYLAFVEDSDEGLRELNAKFPKASYHASTDPYQQDALSIFHNDWGNLQKIKLHLKATDFQLKVWESLLKIPLGKLSTYGQIAQTLGKPNAYRAVGTAIGNNPIAFLIPCHRVIQSSGSLSGYRWGPSRKAAIIGWEQAKVFI